MHNSVTYPTSNVSVTAWYLCSSVFTNILAWVCSIALWGACLCYIMIYKLIKVYTNDHLQLVCSWISSSCTLKCKHITIPSKVESAKTNTPSQTNSYKCLPIAITIKSNLVSTTLVYMTPSILRHILAWPNFLVQNSLFHMTTTLNNKTFRNSILPY